MDLATSTGRNDPCPCGSGRKYKKCCLETQESAGRADPDDDFDPPAIVDRAINENDWRPLDPFVDRFVDLAGRGGRLEHLRFPTDACDCSAGWLGWCEREIAYALGRIEDPGARRAL